MNESPFPDTHVFIGMFRPAVDPCANRQAFAMCPVCTINTVQFGCWSKGHFDTPQYARREEILDRMARGEKP